MPRQRRKYFTVDEANATLPLLRSILRDVTELARVLYERHERIVHMQSSGSIDRLTPRTTTSRKWVPTCNGD